MFRMMATIALATLVVSLWMFALGLRAWRQARQQRPGLDGALKSLALQLWEPLLSGGLVLLWGLTDLPWSRSGFWTAWWLSAPILALLLVIVWRWQDHGYQRQRQRLLKLGLARWGMILAMLLSIFFNAGFLGAAFPTVPLLLGWLSVSILSYAAFCGYRTLQHAAEPVPIGFPDRRRAVKV